MLNKKLKPISSSKLTKESKELKDDDFSYRFTAQTRSKSTPRRVRFAEKPLCPESDPEDSIILRDQIEMRMKSGEPPEPILKDTEYVPPQPSYLRLLRRRLIRKTRKNARNIIGITLFLLFAFILFELMFRWGNSNNLSQRQRRFDAYQTNKIINNYEQDHKMPLFIGFNVESDLNQANDQFVEDISNHIPVAILASCMTALIGIALYFLVL